MRAKTNVVIDLVIGAAFLVAVNPPVLGLAVHEWLGLAFAAALVAHLVLHWEWIAAATRRLFTREGRRQRLNVVVDACLFVALTAAVVSGLMISRHVLAALGLPTEPARGWRSIHSLASDVSIAAIGVHLGLHWKWIALNVPRFVAPNGGATRGERAAGPASGHAGVAQHSGFAVSHPSTAR
jgi:hypothetical protein